MCFPLSELEIGEDVMNATLKPWTIVEHNGYADIFAEEGGAIVIMVNPTIAGQIVADHNRSILLDEAKAALAEMIAYFDKAPSERQGYVVMVERSKSILAKMEQP